MKRKRAKPLRLPGTESLFLIVLKIKSKTKILNRRTQDKQAFRIELSRSLFPKNLYNSDVGEVAMGLLNVLGDPVCTLSVIEECSAWSPQSPMILPSGYGMSVKAMPGRQYCDSLRETIHPEIYMQGPIRARKPWNADSISIVILISVPTGHSAISV